VLYKAQIQAGLPLPPSTPIVTTPGVRGGPRFPEPPTESKSLAEIAELIDKIRRCRHRGENPACGCQSMSRCAAKQSDVAQEDCFRCIEATNSSWQPVATEATPYESADEG
jgi:hypothetical protein